MVRSWRTCWDDEVFYDFASVHQNECVSFHLGGVTEALHMELRARARMCGMSLGQFVIAVLGHLAWRTPFAEDCEPFEFWDPDRAASAAELRAVDQE